MSVSRKALRKSIITVSLWLLILAFPLCCTVFADPPDLGFEVSGVMESWQDTVTNSTLKDTCEFEVAVKGNQWLETTKLTNGQTMIQGCDGRDVYWLLLDRTGKKVLCDGRVTEGLYPLHSIGALWSTPWLAYCSSDYFAKQLPSGTGPSPSPWRLALLDPTASIYSVRLETLVGSGGLPLSVQYQPDPVLIETVSRQGWYGFSGLTNSEHDKTMLAFSVHYSNIKEPEAVYNRLYS
ncbi:MAG: hypothetical protein JWR26_2149 [Pedosphaera sp.]|nr:hypothetical protein [Pedosphaera sp.]